MRQRHSDRKKKNDDDEDDDNNNNQSNSNPNLEAKGGAVSNESPNSRDIWIYVNSQNECIKPQCRRCPSPRVLSLLLERGGSFE